MKTALILAAATAVLLVTHWQVSWLPIWITGPVVVVAALLNYVHVRRVIQKNRERESSSQSAPELSLGELKEQIVFHAEEYLPTIHRWLDLLRPKDVYSRVHHRRVLRRLIDEGVVQHRREDPSQLINWLFYEDKAMRIKIGRIYGYIKAEDLWDDIKHHDL